MKGGAVLILEGESSLAELGFRRQKENVRVGSLTGVHNPSLAIVWENALELPVFDLPEGATVFAKERWTGAPMMAGARRGSGAVLWVAVPPGKRGYERFPYLLQALCDLGVETPFRAGRLWIPVTAHVWIWITLPGAGGGQESPHSHVAAWHFYEPREESDGYLKKLIEPCHRDGILVYAWLELPHVSEQFWKEHPAWREKTAAKQTRRWIGGS